MNNKSTSDSQTSLVNSDRKSGSVRPIVLQVDARDDPNRYIVATESEKPVDSQGTSLSLADPDMRILHARPGRQVSRECLKTLQDSLGSIVLDRSLAGLSTLRVS